MILALMVKIAAEVASMVLIMLHIRNNNSKK